MYFFAHCIDRKAPHYFRNTAENSRHEWILQAVNSAVWFCPYQLQWEFWWKHFILFMHRPGRSSVNCIQDNSSCGSFNIRGSPEKKTALAQNNKVHKYYLYLARLFLVIDGQGVLSSFRTCSEVVLVCMVKVRFGSLVSFGWPGLKSYYLSLKYCMGPINIGRHISRYVTDAEGTRNTDNEIALSLIKQNALNRKIRMAFFFLNATFFQNR